VRLLKPNPSPIISTHTKINTLNLHMYTFAQIQYFLSTIITLSQEHAMN
jgi:hypothetical protein